jgi:23S rRNA (cytidine1920-2'-O)/16S rRNA (cytidine1409-2'-O)-methyltransferase
MTKGKRADIVLVERGLFESRAKAQAAIAAGLVTADGVRLHKSAETIAEGAVLSAAPAHPYVSRGALKLVAALDHFGFDPADRICLDVGASTGGFTEVLLARGARSVHAVDVGRDQLHARLRADARVIVREQSDVRSLDPALFATLPNFVTIDVSFISLKLVLPALDRLTRSPAQLIALIKPQFEAGKAKVKKGVVRDAAIHSAVCEDIAAFATSLGWTVVGIIASPIEGGEGNKEFLLAAQR